MKPTLLAGTSLYVSTVTPATNTQAGFDALAWTQVRGVRVLGDIGKQYNVQSYQCFGMAAPINKRYGLRAMSVNVELVKIADAGQTLIKGAIDACSSYAYKIVEPDGATSYFTATVSSRMSGKGDPKNLADTKLVLELDAPPIEI